MRSIYYLSLFLVSHYRVVDSNDNTAWLCGSKNFVVMWNRARSSWCGCGFCCRKITYPISFVFFFGHGAMPEFLRQLRKSQLYAKFIIKPQSHQFREYLLRLFGDALARAPTRIIPAKCDDIRQKEAPPWTKISLLRICTQNTVCLHASCVCQPVHVIYRSTNCLKPIYGRPAGLERVLRREKPNHLRWCDRWMRTASAMGHEAKFFFSFYLCVVHQSWWPFCHVTHERVTCVWCVCVFVFAANLSCLLKTNNKCEQNCNLMICRTGILTTTRVIPARTLG